MGAEGYAVLHEKVGLQRELAVAEGERGNYVFGNIYIVCVFGTVLYVHVQDRVGSSWRRKFDTT